MFITNINKIVIGLTLLIVLFLPNPAYADNGSESETFYQRGGVCIDNRQYNLAIIEYTKAIALNPQYAKAYNNRGLAYYNNLQYDLARADFTKAIELNPQYDLAYWNRGDVYAMKYETSLLAIADFTKAIALNPDESYYYSRAEVYNKISNHRLAVDDYNQVLKIHPHEENTASAKRHLFTSYGGGHYYGEEAVYDPSFNPF